MTLEYDYLKLLKANILKMFKERLAVYSQIDIDMFLLMWKLFADIDLNL